MQLRQETPKITELAQLTDYLCSELSRICGLKTRPPYPSMIHGVVEPDKITLVVTYSTGVLPVNTEAWLRTEAKKFFSKVNKNRKEKLKIPSKIVIQPQYSVALEGSESAEKTIYQFAKNLETLCADKTLLQKVELIPTSENKIEFLRNYFLDNLLFDNEFKKCFHYSQHIKGGGILGSVLIEVMTAMEREFNDLTTQPVFHQRLHQLVFANLKEKDIQTIFIKNESFVSIDSDAFLKLLADTITTLPPRKAWNLYSTCYSLVEDALQSLEKKMPRYEALLLEFEKFFTTFIKISSAFQDIDRKGQHLLLGETFQHSCIVIDNASTYFLNKDNYKETLNKRFIDNIILLKNVLTQMKEKINPLVSKPQKKPSVSSAPAKVSPVFFPSTPVPVIEDINPLPLPSSTIQSDLSDSPSVFIQQSIFADNFNKECRNKAKQLIEAEQVRAVKHENRHKATKVVTGSEHREEQNNSPENTLSLQVQIKNHSQNITAIPLISDINLYISLDMVLKPKAEFDRYISVASNLKILEQDSLGSNGIKIYGMRLLSVKCKQSKGDRLIFLSHKIQNTNHYIYLPHAIVTHDKYENLLNNKKALTELREKARNEVEVTQIPAQTMNFKNFG